MDELIEALKLAKGIIDYCGADSWEMECTISDRNRFYEICDKYIPEPSKDKGIFYDVHCQICNRHFIHDSAYKSHLLGKKHLKKTIQKTKEDN